MFIEEFQHTLKDGTHVKFSIWGSEIDNAPCFSAQVINIDLENYKKLPPAEQKSFYGANVRDENNNIVYYSNQKKLKADLIAKYSIESMKSELSTNIEIQDSNEVKRFIGLIMDMITYAEDKLGYPSPRPTLKRWQIGYCSSPRDSIGNSKFGFYWDVSKLSIAKEIINHFTDQKSVHMGLIPYERSSDEMSVRFVVVRTVG